MLEALKWFSKGFYILRQIDNKLILSDLRFGEIKEEVDEPISKWGFAFSWQIDSEENKLKKIEGANKDLQKALKNLYGMAVGNI